MAEYYVRWEIDIEANSLLDAAQKARAIQLDFDNTATIFEVVKAEDAGMCEEIIPWQGIDVANPDIKLVLASKQDH